MICFMMKTKNNQYNNLYKVKVKREENIINYINIKLNFKILLISYKTVKMFLVLNIVNINQNTIPMIKIYYNFIKI